MESKLKNDLDDEAANLNSEPKVAEEAKLKCDESIKHNSDCKEYQKHVPSDSIVLHICKILEESTDNLKRDEELKERPESNQIHRSGDGDIGDKEKLFPKSHNPQKSFRFESLLNSESSDLKKRENNRRESSSFSNLGAYLSRHISISSQGGSLAKLKTEHSIEQNFYLLKILKKQKPLKEGADENFFRNEDIFKHKQLLHSAFSAPHFLYFPRSALRVAEMLRFYKDKLGLNKEEVDCTLNRYVSFFSEETQGKGQPRVYIIDKSEFQPIVKYCEILQSHFKEKFEFLNIASFYYIKMQIEELYSLIGPGSNSDANDAEDRDAIRYFAEEARKAIKLSVEKYDKKNSTSILEDSDSFKELESKEITEQDLENPRETWTKILSCYYDYTRELRFSLLSRLSINYDNKTKVFLEFLLSHPQSFLMSKNILDVNWNLINNLIAVYKQYGGQSGHASSVKAKNKSDKELSEMNIYCTNVSLHFEWMGNEKDCSFTLDCGETFEPNCSIYAINSNSKDFPKKLCTKLIHKIDEYFEACKAERKENEVRKGDELKIKALNIDFYSTFYNKEENQEIEVELRNQISENKILEENLRIELLGKLECFFNYTMKKGNRRKDDIESEEREEVSLFNYYYLSEILLEKHIGSLNPRAFYIVREETKAAEMVKQEKIEVNSNQTSVQPGGEA